MIPVVHDDLEAWLTAWIRARLPELTALDVAWVSNAERPGSLGGPPKAGEVHVIVRDDSGPRRDLVLRDSTIGVTMLGATVTMLAPLRAAMEQLVAHLEVVPLEHGPVVDVLVLSTQTVPTGDGSARVYSVLDLTVRGT